MQKRTEYWSQVNAQGGAPAKRSWQPVPVRGTGASTRGGTHIKLFKEDPSAWLHPFSGSSRNAACRTWLLSPGILSSWSQTRNQLSDKVGQQQLTITLSSCLWTGWHRLASRFPPCHSQVPVLSCARKRETCRRRNYCISITCWANIWRCYRGLAVALTTPLKNCRFQILLHAAEGSLVCILHVRPCLRSASFICTYFVCVHVYILYIWNVKNMGLI